MLAKAVTTLLVAVLAMVMFTAAAVSSLVSVALHTTPTQTAPPETTPRGDSVPSDTASRPDPPTRSRPEATDDPAPPTPGPTRAGPPGSAVADIPAGYLRLYRAAAASCPGLDWSVLAAVGKLESDHGRSPLPGVRSGGNAAASAMGPMQIIPATWRAVTTRHPPPPGGASPPSPYNPHDAIHTAAHYLCDSGARDGHDIPAALFTYNRASWYVQKVLAIADSYRHTTPTTPSNPTPAPAPPGRPDPTPTTTPPAPRRTPPASGQHPCAALAAPTTSPSAPASTPGLAALRYACLQLGKPYVWAGNGNPDFDCSGLTAAAYHSAGITIPRTAQTQYDTGPRLPPNTRPQPGDLVFFGTPNRIRHVGIVLTHNTMINAPDFRQTVRIQDFTHRADLIGYSRPQPL